MIEDCARAVLEVTGSKRRISYKALLQGYPMRRKPDISKAQRLFD